MNYFGWSLSARLFMNDPDWIQSLDIHVDDELEPDVEGWNQIFSKLEYTLKETKLNEKLGGCYHVTKEIPRLLDSFDMLDELKEAVGDIKERIPFQFGKHSSFGKTELILTEQFPETLEKDIFYCEKIGGKTLVEHPPPKEPNNVIPQMVDVLTSDRIVNLLKKTDVILCWENMPYPEGFFGSLKHLVEFRNELAKKYEKIGEPELINQNDFCFDTGHLLTWRHKNLNGIEFADKEIAEYLPIFAEHIKVFHIHANDGTDDNHLIPFSTEFFNHESRNGMNPDMVMKYSQLVLDWLKVCKNNLKLDQIDWHIEALRMPFSLNQIINFGKKLYEIL